VRVVREASRLRDVLRSRLEARRGRLGRLAGKLESLSPLAVLSRGYALVWDGDGRLVRDPAEVEVGQDLRIRVGGGRLGARVTTRETP
jgi:exodeoxyribonuclease VII large subunit